MLVTSGDIFFALFAGGLTAAFTGVALATASSPRARLCGAALLVAVTATILSPALGLVALLARFVPIT